MGFWVSYTKNEPKESNLVGVYKPDLMTRILISKESDFPATNSEIKLDADGKIELINVMGWLTENETNMAGARLVSTNGNWHLQKVGKYWQIVLEPENVTDYGLRLVGEKPAYKIQIYNWKTSVPFYFTQDTN
jgi:hypothetical protein